MIYVKDAEQIELMRESNLVLGKMLGEMAKQVRPGISTLELDRIAEEFIRDNGALPGCKGFEGYPNTLCTSVNDVVVHGIPSAKCVLKEGDIISIDCCTLKNGYYGDSTYTFEVGEVNPEIHQLLQTTKEALYKGIEKAMAGMRVGDISYAVETYCVERGYSVVRELEGHGIGHEMHEEPGVPNYGKRGHGAKLAEGMVIAIEPMINMGKRYVYQENDGWTIRTRDHQPSAHFEHSVAIGRNGADILSTFEFVEKELARQKVA